MGGKAATVSVCIPTYQGARFIADTIDSVLAQTWPDFELIIVDDQSPDETEALVGAYRDPRIRYFRNPRNLGPEGNWNRCLELARGEYFKLLPHDDLLAPNCLAEQVAALEADAAQAIALVFGFRRIIGPQGRVLATRGRVLPRAGRLSGPALIRRTVRSGGNLIGEPGNGLFRRALLDQLGHYDASFPYVVDLDWWFRLLLHGDAYYTATEASSFRISAGSWSVEIGKRQHLDFAGLVDRIARDSRYGLGGFDRVLGKLMARALTPARALFYRFTLQDRRRGA
jgi:glycosyltransferase involved in cell wall biosynthesis